MARNLKPLFEQAGYEVLAPSHSEMDLMNYDATFAYLMKFQPDVIIHTASKGGSRLKPDTWGDVLVPNLRMFEVLYLANGRPGWPTKKRARIITLGSGAEFDRRHSICFEPEHNLHIRCPMDPYGLSKNMISRMATQMPEVTVLRIFGCFNFDEEPTRFIKRNILNLKQGLPIEIYNDIYMDFFYLDDVFAVMNWVIKENPKPTDINLIYQDTLLLSEIADMIKKHAKMPDAEVRITSGELGNAYAGNCFGALFHNKFPFETLVGLDEGIRRTVAKLL